MSETSRHIRKKRVRRQAVAWALKLADDELSVEDRQAFDGWLSADPLHVKELNTAQELLGETRRAVNRDPETAKELIRGRRSTSVYSVAIIAAALLSAGAFFALDGPLYLRADVVSATNEMPVVLLEDGSRLYLNADSAFSQDFKPGVREIVLLKGEAYFDVAKDPTRPFIVRAAGGTVRVLGTEFDVNIVDGAAEVSVAKNSVEVIGKAGDAAMLEPGMRVAYNTVGELGPVERISDHAIGGWRSGRLIFENRSLPTVVDEISRYLPGKIVIAKNALRSRRITGTFDLSDPQQAIESFARAFNLEVFRIGRFLTIIY